MTLREELTKLIADVTYVDAAGQRYGMRLLEFPPDYKPDKSVHPNESIHYEMTIKGAQLTVFLCNNAEAIRDALP